jgi:hypothetical protein
MIVIDLINHFTSPHSSRRMIDFTVGVASFDVIPTDRPHPGLGWTVGDALLGLSLHALLSDSGPLSSYGTTRGPLP